MIPIRGCVYKAPLAFKRNNLLKNISCSHIHNIGEKIQLSSGSTLTLQYNSNVFLVWIY